MNGVEMQIASDDWRVDLRKESFSIYFFVHITKRFTVWETALEM